MKLRFSKARLLANLNIQVDDIARRHGFTTDSGTHQLHKYKGTDLLLEKSVTYGQWISLRGMINLIENY